MRHPIKAFYYGIRVSKYETPSITRAQNPQKYVRDRIFISPTHPQVSTLKSQPNPEPWENLDQ